MARAHNQFSLIPDEGKKVFLHTALKNKAEASKYRDLYFLAFLCFIIFLVWGVFSLWGNSILSKTEKLRDEKKAFDKTEVQQDKIAELQTFLDKVDTMGALIDGRRYPSDFFPLINQSVLPISVFTTLDLDVAGSRLDIAIDTEDVVSTGQQAIAWRPDLSFAVGVPKLQPSLEDEGKISLKTVFDLNPECLQRRCLLMPTNVAARKDQTLPNAIIVSWVAVPKADGYQVQACLQNCDDLTNWYDVKDGGTVTDGSATSAVLKGLRAGANYYVRVQATGSAKVDSSYSPVVRVDLS